MSNIGTLLDKAVRLEKEPAASKQWRQDNTAEKAAMPQESARKTGYRRGFWKILMARRLQAGGLLKGPLDFIEPTVPIGPTGAPGGPGELRASVGPGILEQLEFM